MAIFYNKMERNSLGEKGGKRFWYPVVRSTGTMKEKKFIKKLAKEVNLDPKRVEWIMSKMSELIVEGLLNGEIIPLGELGSLRTTLKAEPSESEEEVNSSKIKKTTVLFTESGWLKHVMKEAKFLHTSAIAKKEKKKR